MVVPFTPAQEQAEEYRIEMGLSLPLHASFAYLGIALGMAVEIVYGPREEATDGPYGEDTVVTVTTMILSTRQGVSVQAGGELTK